MIIENSLGVYQIEDLIRPEIIHGFSTKDHGNMAYKYGKKDDVSRNRLQFARLVGLDTEKVVQMDLVHGTKVAVVTSQDSGSLTQPKYQKETDAVITSDRRVALWLLTGDCPPYIFYDPRKMVIALAHSGWKGTVGKIVPKTVETMVNHFHCNIADILVGIGPSIEKCCYINLRPTLQESLSEWLKFATNINKRTARVDLNGFTINELGEIGLPRKNIFYSNFCTQDHSDKFFCSQEETAGKAPPGRFATVIQMV